MFKSTYFFFRDICAKRSIIFDLVKRDIKQQYIASYLGIVWIFLQPLLFIIVIYMVFTLGFRTGRPGDMPFSLYLINGIISWLYFSKNLSANTEVISKYSFLVKKVSFRLSVLPIVTMISASVSHIFLLFVSIGFSWYQGYPPSLYLFQLIYYFLAMFLLLLGMSWLTSACNLFVKDVANVVSIIIQFGFWLTPIFWNIEMVPERFQWIVKLNPMFYIVEGYRDSIVLQIGFWNKGGTVYFWIITLFFLVVGINVFRRLKPHFAEVV